MRFLDVSGIRSSFDEAVVVADGTRLSADIYRPAKVGRYPALVTRTPYDNNRFAAFGSGVNGRELNAASCPAERYRRLAAQGYVVVACDVRGRGDSDGAFAPFTHELDDGNATIQWVRRLPEVNGRIGVFGSGYAGFTALAALTGGEVDAAAVFSPFSCQDVPYSGGVLRLEWLFWLHLVGGRTPQPADVPRWSEIFRHLPLLSMHESLGRDDIEWTEWLEKGPAPHSTVEQDPDLGSSPTLFVTGWWDPAASGTVREWEVAREHFPDAGHSLLVGPWDPEAVRRPRANVGGVAWGPDALIDPDQLLIEWFDGQLKEGHSRFDGCRIFVTGRNEWKAVNDLETADPARTKPYLESEGAANTRLGNGRLIADGLPVGPADRFTHDPERPVPWQPDHGSFSRAKTAQFALETSFISARDDVLIYDGEPTNESLCMIGRPAASLWVESTAEDADWIVAIADLFPGGGKSILLTHGVARAAFEQPVRPGQVVRMEVELSPVAHELLPGHSIRLLVCSSLFPLYAVNPGGSDYLRTTRPQRAEHSVSHTPDRPSSIEVPLRTSNAGL